MIDHSTTTPALFPVVEYIGSAASNALQNEQMTTEEMRRDCETVSDGH